MNIGDHKRFKDIELNTHLQRLVKITECLCFLPICCYAIYLRIYPSYKYVPKHIINLQEIESNERSFLTIQEW